MRHRATPTEVAAAERAASLARRIGVAVRDARLALGLTQREVAARAGITQAHVSRLERGLEPAASLVTLAATAAAVDTQLAAFIEARPGSTLPRDIEHLRRQQLVLTAAGAGGWRGEPEALVQEDGRPQRSIDVLLTREARAECAVVEIWNLMPDVGEAMRGLEGKIGAVQRRLGSDWRVRGLLVVRATRRNRTLVGRLRALFLARYPASSRGWLLALTQPDAAMPDAAGFLWTTVDGGRLVPARLK